MIEVACVKIDYNWARRCSRFAVFFSRCDERCKLARANATTSRSGEWRCAPCAQSGRGGGRSLADDADAPRLGSELIYGNMKLSVPKRGAIFVTLRPR